MPGALEKEAGGVRAGQSCGGGENGGPREWEASSAGQRGLAGPCGEPENGREYGAEGGRVTRPEGPREEVAAGCEEGGREGGMEVGAAWSTPCRVHPLPRISRINSPDIPSFPPFPCHCPSSQTSGSRRTGNAPSRPTSSARSKERLCRSGAGPAAGGGEAQAPRAQHPEPSRTPWDLPRGPAWRGRQTVGLPRM